MRTEPTRWRPRPSGEAFERMLKRAGGGRIRLEVEIHQGGGLATRFAGIFAAALR